MSRLLVLTPAPISAASTRFRLVQYFPALRAAGIEPILRPFLDETGFRALYQSGQVWTKLRAAVGAIVGRLIDLLRATRADAVLIHREAALVGPPLLEWKIARALSRPTVFDVDDAIWVPYASPTYGAALSRLLKMPGKTNFTLAAARHVIAGNPYIADYAHRFNSRVDVIPTIVDTDTFRPSPRGSANDPVVIGWIGTHSSLQYLSALRPALRRLAARRRFVLRVIGATLEDSELPLENVRWSLEREVADFQSLDIGIYPLTEDSWSVGKSGFKAVQYMACGVPVVASNVGVTGDMVHPGKNGLLAHSEEEWLDCLQMLIDDEPLRRRLGEQGRNDAVTKWSLAAHAPRFVSIVLDAMEAA